MKLPDNFLLVLVIPLVVTVIDTVLEVLYPVGPLVFPVGTLKVFVMAYIGFYAANKLGFELSIKWRAMTWFALTAAAAGTLSWIIILTIPQGIETITTMQKLVLIIGMPGAFGTFVWLSVGWIAGKYLLKNETKT